MQAAPSEATCCARRAAPARSCSHARCTTTARGHAAAAPAMARPVRPGQLRRDPRVDPRGRAVRLREGAFHRRRDRRARWPVRGRQRRHAVLDEIGEISRHVQVKLLRVLQEGEIERLGGSARARRIDVRIIAATTSTSPRKSRPAVPRGSVYRLNVIRCRCRRCATGATTSRCSPALRPGLRREDGKAISGCSPVALERLTEYAGRATVRELETRSSAGGADPRRQLDDRRGRAARARSATPPRAPHRRRR